MSKVIELPKKGRLIVVTDIHGNKDDFDKYIDIWDRDDPNCHILFTGDLIHEMDYNKDLSLDILDECIDYILMPNFHVLLGNHELAQITDESVWKYGVNQTKDFTQHIIDRVEEEYKPDVVKQLCAIKKFRYDTLMKSFDYFCITENGFFFSHAGINHSALNQLIHQKVNLFDLKIEKPIDYKFLENMIWSRPYDDYMEDEIDDFLEIVGCKFMCVGHTPYNGFHILGNQLIFDSSFCTDNKYYLDIDLSKDYKDIFEVLKCLEELE